MTNTPRVDVVIPCYNYGHFLRDCVGSCLSQPIGVRVLVIDDCSTDNSAEIGAALAREDSRVTFRRHEKNQGHIATYNEGLLGWATSDYSLLLSADDVVAPGALARAAYVLDKHADASMTYGMGVLFSGTVPALDVPVSGEPEYVLVDRDTFVRRCFEHVNPMETPTAVVRTSLQQKLGGYRPELPHTGDVEMWMRFAVQGPVAVLNTVQAFVRRHPNNMSGGYYNHRLRDCRQVIAAGDTIVQEWGNRFPQIAEWRRAMGVRVSADALNYAGRAFENGDLEQFEAALAFAREVNPDAGRSAIYWKARLRGAFGPALWKSMRPLWSRVMGPAEPREAARLAAGNVQFSGWWPPTS